MENLTKQQKMDMISKAIDFGVEVELVIHGVGSDKQLDEFNSMFDKKINRKLEDAIDSETTWLSINRDDKYEDNFSATAYISSLRGDSDD